MPAAQLPRRMRAVGKRSYSSEARDIAGHRPPVASRSLRRTFGQKQTGRREPERRVVGGCHASGPRQTALRVHAAWRLADLLTCRRPSHAPSPGCLRGRHRGPCGRPANQQVCLPCPRPSALDPRPAAHGASQEPTLDRITIGMFQRHQFMRE